MSCTHLICSLYCTCLLSLSFSVLLFLFVAVSPFILCSLLLYSADLVCIFEITLVFNVTIVVCLLVSCCYYSMFFSLFALLKRLVYSYVRIYAWYVTYFFSFIIFIVCIRGLITDFKCAYKDLLCVCVCVWLYVNRIVFTATT